MRRETGDPGGTKKGAAAPDTGRSRSKQQISCDYTSEDEGWVRTRRRGDEELSPHQEKEEMRERVWGIPDVQRAAGCVRTQGTLPGSIWKCGMWRGVATQVRTHRTHGTQEIPRLCQDATPTDQTQGPFLLMWCWGHARIRERAETKPRRQPPVDIHFSILSPGTGGGCGMTSEPGTKTTTTRVSTPAAAAKTKRMSIPVTTTMITCRRDRFRLLIAVVETLFRVTK